MSWPMHFAASEALRFLLMDRMAQACRRSYSWIVGCRRRNHPAHLSQCSLAVALSYLAGAVTSQGTVRSNCGCDTVRPNRPVYTAQTQKNPVSDWAFENGEGGIRTHGGSHLAGFQDQSHQPLDHLSSGGVLISGTPILTLECLQFSGFASGSRHLSESHPAGPASLSSPLS